MDANLTTQKNLIIVITSSFTLLILGCSLKTTGPQDQPTKKDSVSSSDSTSLISQITSTLPMTYEQRQGKYVYQKYCSICHGTEGKGDGFNAFNLDPKPRDFTDKKYLDALTDARIVETIAGGGRAVNKSAVMPSWSGRLNKAEITYLVAYIRTFSE